MRLSTVATTVHAPIKVVFEDVAIPQRATDKAETTVSERGNPRFLASARH